MFSFRLDREGSLFVIGPLWQKLISKREGCAPILMYHSVSDDREERIRPYYRVATSPDRFAEQMQWLTDIGYKGIALEELLPSLVAGAPVPHRLVAITFDDGFRDFHSVAWPILRRHGFTATMYLPTDFVS